MSRHLDAAAETQLGTSLTGVLDRLRTAHDLGVDRLPQDHLERLHSALDRAGTRRSLSGDHTVVGVFGPTGSGKSSLVNALSGTDAARVAARRPTTSEPLALVWGRQGSYELLDWLDVRQRVELPDGALLVAGAGGGAPAAEPTGPAGPAQIDGAQAGKGVAGRGPAEVLVAATARNSSRDGANPDQAGRDSADLPTNLDQAGDAAERRPRWGLFRWRRRRSTSTTRSSTVPSKVPVPLDSAAGLILLDLPDFDSITLAHREIVHRLAGQVDVLLWVVDPQKYADAALHHDFLQELATHEAVTLVALNQADRLDTTDLDAVTASLEAILADEGLRNVVVLPVSARTGQGVGDLSRQIRELAESRAAATRRMVADAARSAAELLPFTADPAVAMPSGGALDALADELGSAAGVRVVVDAVRSAYRRDAHATMGWPVTRWLAGLRPDPLRRLNLRSQDMAPELRRSSLPLAQPAQRARVDHALRVFGDAAAGDVVEPWHTSIRDAARDTAGELTDALDTAVTGTDLETGRRAWWGIFGVLQWIAFAALVAGLAWLGVLAVLGFLQLPAIDVPRVEGFPVPTLLILGGLTAGVLLGVVAALLARWGAGRRASRVRKRLLDACSGVAHDVVLQPVADEIERCNAFTAAVLAASGRG
ncbi:GTPase [Arthrobacter cheniae]|uniref:GTPase n=1 Tax=Arthrobacter cheniae TaxID=1258888 RepID=UPI001F232E88|nr:GTPase [Arthrobacter cheniae]